MNDNGMMENDLRILKQENGLGETRYLVVGHPWVKGTGFNYGVFTSYADAEAKVEEILLGRQAHNWQTVREIKPAARPPQKP